MITFVSLCPLYHTLINIISKKGRNSVPCVYVHPCAFKRQSNVWNIGDGINSIISFPFD